MKSTYDASNNLQQLAIALCVISILTKIQPALVGMFLISIAAVHPGLNKFSFRLETTPLPFPMAWMFSEVFQLTMQFLTRPQNHDIHFRRPIGNSKISPSKDPGSRQPEDNGCHSRRHPIAPRYQGKDTFTQLESERPYPHWAAVYATA